MKKQKIKSLLLVPLVFASITTGVVYAEETAYYFIYPGE